MKVTSVSEHGRQLRPAAPLGSLCEPFPQRPAACSGQGLAVLPPLHPTGGSEVTVSVWHRKHFQTVLNPGSPKQKTFGRCACSADEEAKAEGPEIRSNSRIPFEPGDADMFLTSF